MERPNLRIAVEGFGPVKTGSVELKPLTIFIGPNNSGKSYIAQLAYALCQGLSGRIPRPFMTPDRFEAYLFGLYRDSASRTRLADLSHGRQDSVRAQIDQTLQFVRSTVEYSLAEYFGTDAPRQLTSAGRGEQSLAVRIDNRDDLDALLALHVSDGAWRVELVAGDVGQWMVPADLPFPSSNGESEGWALSRFLWSELLVSRGFPAGHIYYLPSARSGIVAAAELYLSLAFQLIRSRGAMEQITLAPFEGVAGDFLQVLANLTGARARSNGQDEARELHDVADFLESHVLHGQTVAQQDPLGQVAIHYESGDLRLPLQRTSSMVAELAPLDLWIRHVLLPGDLLIIDEPEAHLHPENQRRIAKALVRLVRSGVRVLCPTHSSLILHEVSNALLAGEVSGEDRHRLGIADEEVIHADDVGVYLFALEQNGTHISSVPIESGFGISEDEFVRVAEAIGEETYHLSVAGAGSIA